MRARKSSLPNIDEIISQCNLILRDKQLQIAIESQEKIEKIPIKASLMLPYFRTWFYKKDTAFSRSSLSR